MNKKLIYLLALVFSLGLSFTACGDDDDDDVNLELDKTEVTVAIGTTQEVKITKGNNDYKVAEDNKDIATASVSGTTITITGVAKGTTNINVTDKAGKKAVVKVTVKDVAESIAATYNGSMVITLMGEANDPITGQDVIVEKSAANKAKLSIKDFSFAGVDAGTIVVDNIVLTEADGAVNFAETKVNVPLAANTMTADVTIEATTNIKDNKLTLNVKVNNVLLGTTPMPLGDILVAFTGAKK